MANAHAREHADCTREEVAGFVRENGTALSAFISDLSDEQLGRKTWLSLAGGEVTTGQFIDMVVLQSGGEHFANIKKAVG